MRIFLDFEFIENGNEHPIIPISVGLVREDGLEYYAEFPLTDEEWGLANEWVIANVKPYTGIVDSKPREVIGDEIIELVGEKPEFWGYYADYDWVILCNIYGRMIDLPHEWPKYCLDLNQYMYHLGLKLKDIHHVLNEQEHNALADAKWNRELFAYLLQYTESQRRI